jgi:hypothetical protein
VSVSSGQIARHWWRRRFHPISRVGWSIATAGQSRPISQTLVGYGLVGAGFVLKRRSGRKAIYRGYIEPGTGTHIRVLRGASTVIDMPLEG